MNPLDVVQDWNVDAANDQSAELFVQQGSEDRILDGRRSLVIGRRGTGKTALAKYICRKAAPRSVLLDLELSAFDEFDHDESVKNISREDQISNWIYLIIMSAIEVFYREKIVLDYDTREKYAHAFEYSSKLSFREKSAKWFERDYALSPAGLGALSTQLRPSGNARSKALSPRERRLALEQEFRIFETSSPIYIVLITQTKE